LSDFRGTKGDVRLLAAPGKVMKTAT